jgi:hypothetical protein
MVEKIVTERFGRLEKEAGQHGVTTDECQLALQSIELILGEPDQVRSLILGIDCFHQFSSYDSSAEGEPHKQINQLGIQLSEGMASLSGSEIFMDYVAQQADRELKGFSPWLNGNWGKAFAEALRYSVSRLSVFVGEDFLMTEYYSGDVIKGLGSWQKWTDELLADVISASVLLDETGFKEYLKSPELKLEALAKLANIMAVQGKTWLSTPDAVAEDLRPVIESLRMTKNAPVAQRQNSDNSS